jgi:hypothetical protein
MSVAPRRRPKFGPGRPGFMEWVAKHPSPNWGIMPLTHIAKSVIAEDIIRAGQVNLSPCTVFDRPLAYFFYGRPAYRIGKNEITRAVSFCPFCFVFNPELAKSAAAIHAFDTGAFAARLYSHMLPDEMHENDFRLASVDAVNRLISAVFRSQTTYFDANTDVVALNSPVTSPHEFHARAYLDLITSRGRNEPDDRVCSIELAFTNSVSLTGNLMAVVLPHTLCAEGDRAPWLSTLSSSGVALLPYEFIPGRHPEHYHTLMEAALKMFYKEQGYLT